MSHRSVTIFVCTACRFPASNEAETGALVSPGQALVARLLANLPDDTRVKVEAVDCLAVCDRPCTIAFSARDKWTYLVGDIDPETDFDDILLAANRLAASDLPILAMADRPPFFRTGVIARVPFLRS